jgi:hypothetical protein
MKATIIEVKAAVAEGSLPVLKDARDQLLKQRTELDSQLSNLNKLIADFEGCTNGNGKNPRLRKGQAFKLVRDLFYKYPEGKGMPLKEISELTGVGTSSAYRVLSRNKTIFQMDSEGLWSMTKTERAKTTIEQEILA